MIHSIINSGIELSISESGDLSYKGDESLVSGFMQKMRQWKPELIRYLRGDFITNVGNCEFCDSPLIGLPVSFDGYVNRVCGDCGRWAICLRPDWSPDDLRQRTKKRDATKAGSGGLLCEDADLELAGVVRAKTEIQKSIFDDADRILYDSKDGRRSGKTDDRVTQLTWS